MELTTQKLVIAVYLCYNVLTAEDRILPLSIN